MEEPGLSEELSGYPDWSYYGSTFGKYGLLVQRDRVFKRHSKTTLGAAHILENSENLANVTAILEANSMYSPPSAHPSPSQAVNHTGASAKTRRVQRMLQAEDEAAVPVRPALAKANCPRKTTYGCPEVHDTHTGACIQKARPQDGDWMGAADPPYRTR